MKWIAAWLLCIAVAPVLRAGDWIKIGSAHFDLLTNGADYDARKTLAAFEETREFFVREQPWLAGSPPRATIIGFNSFDDYRPYSPNSVTLAYFLKGEDGEYIVLSDLQAHRMRIAVHEYVHLLIDHSGLTLPLWLNEGMAEVYSTLQSKEGKMAVGGMQADRKEVLSGGNWMRLPALLRVDAKSPEYNEADLENMFYAQSCLLVDMLMLGEGYRDKFSTFLNRVSVIGTPAAFLEVYGKNTADIERQMRLFFNQSVNGGAVYRDAPAKIDAGAASPANGAELNGILIGFLAHLGRTAEARNRLKELAAQYPGNGDIEAAFGTVDEARDEPDAALEHYRAAVEMHPSGWLPYWKYARFLDQAGGDLAPRVQALEAVVQRKADLTEASLRLGKDLCDSGRYADALARLRDAKDVPPDQAVAMLVDMSIAALGAKQDVEARRYAEQAKAAARTPEETAAVARLLGQMDTAPRGNTETRPPTDDPDRPTLKRTAPPQKGGRGGGGN